VIDLDLASGDSVNLGVGCCIAEEDSLSKRMDLKNDRYRLGRTYWVGEKDSCTGAVDIEEQCGDAKAHEKNKEDNNEVLDHLQLCSDCNCDMISRLLLLLRRAIKRLYMCCGVDSGGSRFSAHMSFHDHWPFV